MASPSFSGGSSRRIVGSGHTSTQTKYRYLIPFPTSPTSSLSSSPSSSLSSSPASGPTAGNLFPRDFGALLNKPQGYKRPARDIGPEDVTYKIFKCEKGRNYAIQFYEKKPAYVYDRGMNFGGRMATEGQGLCLGFAMYEVPEDVEYGDLEKRVFWDEESGEWCLELSNEVVRGRRMKRKHRG
ncbi:hypothetical protein BJ508DRAFT_14957 [Ascobolus immersus RN42]|uniref:Uncharacterized protein n=1 Tax=Ascobolus immersus RN42 TaxID=1160509 RepID=A0A3N4HSJ3_ASCIM|nr:hypothetical protein BJ508DRAFT_14957 [Ascobolus immersus RN42]